MTNGGAGWSRSPIDGSEKWMPHYNVMGVAKAGLEASVRYLAADLGVKKIRVNVAISAGSHQDARRLRHRRLPLHSRLERAQCAAAPQRHCGRGRRHRRLPAFWTLSRGVTGEIHHVDAGYHIVGMKHPDAPDVFVGRTLNPRGGAPRIATAQALFRQSTAETDWNAELAGSGRRDTSPSMPWVANRQRVAANCCATFVPPAAPPRSNSPLPRARCRGHVETMEILRAGLGVPPQDYTTRRAASARTLCSGRGRA